MTTQYSPGDTVVTGDDDAYLIVTHEFISRLFGDMYRPENIYGIKPNVNNAFGVGWQDWYPDGVARGAVPGKHNICKHIVAGPPVVGYDYPRSPVGPQPGDVASCLGSDWFVVTLDAYLRYGNVNNSPQSYNKVAADRIFKGIQEENRDRIMLIRPNCLTFRCLERSMVYPSQISHFKPMGRKP